MQSTSLKPTRRHLLGILWFALAALALGTGLSGCTASANNAQTMQIMQQSRKDANAEPRDKRPETLNVTVAGQGKKNTLEDPPEMGILVDWPEPSGVYDAKNINTAKANAQDAALALAKGESSEAEAALEASFALYPTVDALEHLAPLRPNETAALCLEALAAAPDDATRLEVMQACHRLGGGADVESSLEFATPQQRTWFEAHIDR